MEAVGRRAAQETRAGCPSCTGLQRPAAEGGRDLHPHLRCSHERPHNEPNAARPGACVYSHSVTFTVTRQQCSGASASQTYIPHHIFHHCLLPQKCSMFRIMYFFNLSPSSVPAFLQKWRRLQRVVRSCAMRWKQRALCKPRRELEAKGPPPKKSVTFCLATPGLEGDSPPVSAEQEDDDEEEALRKL